MYSGCDDPTRWVLPAVLEEQAEQHGDMPFVSFIDGDTLSYRRLRDEAALVAGCLSALGVAPGDRIAIMLPNNADFLRAWAGIGRLGAIAVMLNTELTGSFLAYPLANSQPKILIVDGDYVPRLTALDHPLPEFEHILVCGPGGNFQAWRDAHAFAGPMPGAADIACIMYTSGTTGAPKGVLMPHAHCFLFGLGVIENLAVQPDDHYYVCLPLSHANGLLMQLGATLIAGASATVRERFSASAWLDDVCESQATLTNTLGALSAFVVAQPATPRDRDHRLRAILAAPNHPDHERTWRDRFGVANVVGGYGMTEVNIPLYGTLGDPRPGACGRAFSKYFEIELREPDSGMPVGIDEVGEILIRPRVAHAFMAGYFDMPERTVEAWRDLWFHTGDAARIDADGYVYFVDRIKDCIRRRGENISATDVEATFAALPGVAEIAAYPVPSDILGGEDEIMLAIVLEPGAKLDPTAIVDRARTHMPRYAQPRYVDFLPSLPKTGTEKVRKIDLRNSGAGPDTIDLMAWSSGRTAI